MSVLIWIQTVWHSDSVPEGIFFKNLILKKKEAVNNKSMRDLTIDLLNSLPTSVYWKNFLKKLILKKDSAQQQMHEKIPSRQRVNHSFTQLISY